MIIQPHTLEHREAIRFLEENSSSFFTREEWLRVLQEGLKATVKIFCLEEDGEILLALPGLIFNFGIIRMFYSNIPYGGFVGDINRISSTLLFFEATMKRNGIHFIRIGGPSEREIEVFLKHYKRKNAYIHLLNLEGITEETLWRGYKKRVRRDIRKAEKSGLYLEEVKTSNQIDEIYSLYIQTMRRNETFTIWTKNFLHAVHKYLVPHGEAKMIVAKKDDQIASGVIFLFSENTVYYFLSASSERYHSYCPNDLLVHHGICMAIKQGKKYFDLMTSKEGDQPLMQFKEKWGAQRYPFYFYEKRLTFFRPWIWDQTWKIVNSKIGTSLLRALGRG